MKEIFAFYPVMVFTTKMKANIHLVSLPNLQERFVALLHCCWRQFSRHCCRTSNMVVIPDIPSCPTQSSEKCLLPGVGDTRWRSPTEQCFPHIIFLPPWNALLICLWVSCPMLQRWGTLQTVLLGHLRQISYVTCKWKCIWKGKLSCAIDYCSYNYLCLLLSH